MPVPKTAVGAPRSRPIRHEGVAAIINRLDAAIRVRDGLKKQGSDAAQAAVKAQIEALEAQLVAAKEHWDAQAAEANEFIVGLKQKRIAELGLTGAVDVDKVTLP